MIGPHIGRPPRASPRQEVNSRTAAVRFGSVCISSTVRALRGSRGSQEKRFARLAVRAVRKKRRLAVRAVRKKYRLKTGRFEPVAAWSDGVRNAYSCRLAARRSAKVVPSKR